MTSTAASAGTPPTTLPDAGLLPTVAPPTQPAPGGHILTVGAGQEYATIAAAVAAAQNGDVVQVRAGTYVNDFATITSDITIEGVGGMVNLVATEPPPNLKGILTVDNNATIENMTFSGSAIPDADGGNGAGIRYEGGQMSLENCAFTGNQNGILAAPVIPTLTTNTISVDHCLFSGNGSGSGYTHNLYVGAVTQLTATNSVFQDAVVGHQFKSRALANTITGDVFQDGPTGDASYEIDLPNGGADTITGNIIEKGPNAQNEAMVHFGGEGLPYAGSSLTITGNTFVNDYGSSAVAVLNQTPYSAQISGNQFDNFAGATIVDGPATGTGNVDGNGIPIPNITQTGVLPGSTEIFTDNLPHTVTLDNGLLAVEGGGGLLTAYAIGGHFYAIGGSGGLVYTEAPGSGGNIIMTAAGSTNSITVVGQDTIGSAGTDTIVCGAGNITGAVSGQATIDDGTGNNTWAITGSAQVTAQGGNPRFLLGAQGTLSVGGALGFLEVTNGGGALSFDVVQGGAEEAGTFLGGSFDLQIYNATMNVTTAASPVGATLYLTTGNALVVSMGADTIYAGSGNDTICVFGAATVYAGSGTLSVFGHGSPGASFYGNGGTYTLGGDTGNFRYYGGSQASTLNLQLSSNTIIGQGGRLTINGGSRETIVGGRGGIVYSAIDGGGANSITTAAGSHNTLKLAGADNVESWGGDLIMGGTGNQTLDVHGTSKVFGSTGNSQITFWGNDSFYGRGQDWITVESGANVTISAGKAAFVSETGATVAYSTATASATVTNGSAGICNSSIGGVAVTTSAGTSTSVVAGSGVVAITANGADQIQAGSGCDSVVVTAGGATVTGGSGMLTFDDCDWAGSPANTVTIYGGSGSISADQGPGSMRFIGGSGTATINGEYGKLYVVGGSGNLSVSGGSAGETFIGGSGNAQLNLTPSGASVTFGSGATTVQEANYGAAVVYSLIGGSGGGVDVIDGFRAGIDQIQLQGISMVSRSVAGGNTTFGFSDGTSLELAGFVTGKNIFTAVSAH